MPYKDKEREKERLRKYREDHKEELQIRMRKWYDDHKEEKKAYDKQYLADNKEKITKRNKRYSLDVKNGVRIKESKLVSWTVDQWEVGILNQGRMYVYLPTHPKSNIWGYIVRTHAVWWLAYKEVIPKHCVLHHVNGNKLDDRIINLTLMTRAEHMSFHQKKRNQIREEIAQ